MTLTKKPVVLTIRPTNSVPAMNFMKRRTFLSITGIITSFGFLYLLERLVSRQDEILKREKVNRIKNPAINGITFYKDFYVTYNGKSLKAFSTRCTHAGCRLSQEINGIIICPCHGSRFDAMTGRVLSGPAFRPLNPMICKYDASSGEWVISGSTL